MRKLVVIYVYAIFFILQIICASASASALTPGNIVVTSGYKVTELTTTGTVVQSFNVPYKDDGPRDLIVTPNGDIAVYNGTFYPYLSICDPKTGSWRHTTMSGWSTVNNGTYGGVTAFGNSIFATDMCTGGGEAQGLIRWDASTLSAERFAQDQGFTDVTIGRDNLLYALTAYDNIYVYNPSTLEFIKTFDLPFATDCRGIAVDSDGTVFGADWNNHISAYDQTGLKKKTVTLNYLEFMDIDISASGQLVAATRFGQIVMTDRSLDSVQVFTNSNSTFAAFVPEPATLLLLGLGGMMLRKKH